MELSELTARLESNVPAMDSIPSAAQYQQAVIDALADYSTRCPAMRVTDLAITSGTASYNLPADFVRYVGLEALSGPDGMLITDGGIIPGAGINAEQITVSDSTLTLYPTPGYSATRRLTYAGGIITDGSSYSLTERQADLVLKRAAMDCLTIMANAAARQAWQYQLGDERVSKEQLAEELRAQAAELERQYLAGTITQRSGASSAYMVRG